MKITISTTLAAVAAGLMVQSLSAQTVDVTASQGATVGWNNDNTTVADTTGYYQPNEIKTRGSGTIGTSGAYSWKGYLQFDISSALAANGGIGSLTGATLTMYGVNGPSRSFDVWGLLDVSQAPGGANYDNWSAATLTWNNAPGNMLDLYNFSPTATYGGAKLFDNSGMPGTDQTVNYPSSTYTQLASYTTTTGSANLLSYLQTDTDGLVTLGIDGHNNMAWLNAPWAVQDPANGEISPYLTLTFGVVPEPATMSLVALGLGGLLVLRRRRS